MRRPVLFAIAAIVLLTACERPTRPISAVQTNSPPASATAATSSPGMDGGAGVRTFSDPFDFCRAAGDLAFSDIELNAIVDRPATPRPTGQPPYPGPRFAGPLFPFRAGMFVWSWRCADGNVETCSSFARADNCRDSGRDGWQLTTPATTFSRPVPPPPVLDPLPPPQDSGPPVAYRDPYAYCAAIRDTPERFTVPSDQPATGPRWVGEALPFPHPEPAASAVAAWRCDGGAAIVCLARAMGQNCLRTRDVSEQHEDIECQRVRNARTQSNALNSGRYYQWGCSDGTSVITGYRDGPADRLDRYGYARSQWRPMESVTLDQYGR